MTKIYFDIRFPYLLSIIVRCQYESALVNDT